MTGLIVSEEEHDKRLAHGQRLQERYLAYSEEVQATEHVLG